MPQATSIDEVLSQLEKIISDARRSGDRVGYFAALYHKVTSGVKAGIARGDFEDGDRMARLDVLFANRYLQALEDWRAGLAVTDSWKIALEATKDPSLLVLQHLLLGINAHINLDLGIAAVETIQNKQIGEIHRDFDAINAIIGSLTYQVLREIDRMSPFLSLIGLHANRTDSFLVQFSIGNARDGAWCFAEDLSRMTGSAYSAFVMGRDNDVATLGRTLADTTGLLRFTLWIIHLFEWHDPKKIIAELYGFTKRFMKAEEVRKGKR
ncbi:MAG TPA: DUF5995 family protein [Puia sp.]|nr:DUF5995 family protein [Puia sp.]